MAEEKEGVTEVYHRLNRLEQDCHTLQFRVNQIESHNLPIRVANLEPAVKNISVDVSKIESNMDEIKDLMTEGMSRVREEISSMKSWGKGVSVTIASLVALIGLLLAVGEFLK